MRPVGLLAACDDLALLNFRAWPRQRQLLAELERGPRVHVWSLGRRSAKTTTAAVYAVWNAALRPDLDGLVRPGERRYVVAVATNIKQARIFLAAALSVVENSPLLRELLESVNEDEIRLRNGAVIAAFPCSSRGARGYPISALLLDEAAHFVDSDGSAAAEQVWTALTPSLAQFGSEGRVIVSSTPFGEGGFFADLFQKAASGELADAVAVRAPTAEMNPTISAEFLASEEARDPESFRSEYLAEFIGSGAAYLDPERIADAVVDRGPLLPEQGAGWIAGLDPAFSSDPFGLAIVGRDPADRGRLLLGLARSWKPSKAKASSFEERREVEDAVLDEVAALCLRYGARVVSDQYAAPAVVSRLNQAGISVTTVPMTAVSKTAAFAELRARLLSRSLELYEERELLAELRRLRTKFTAGQASVVNPRVGGSHGDMAQALALSIFEHDRYGLARSGPVLAGLRGQPAVVNERALSGVFESSEPVSQRRTPRWYDPTGGIVGRVF